MDVEFDLLPEDVIAFQRYHSKDSGASDKLDLWILGIMTILSLFLVGLILARGLIEGVWMTNFYNVFWIAAFSLIFFLVFLYLKSLPWKLAEQAAKEGKSQRFKLRPKGIEHSSPNGAGIVVWSGIKKVAATENHLFLYISDATAFVMPKRAFRSEAAFREFVTTAEGFHRQATAKAES